MAKIQMPTRETLSIPCEFCKKIAQAGSLPSQAALQSALESSVGVTGNGGLGFNMWASLVATIRQPPQAGGSGMVEEVPRRPLAPDDPRRRYYRLTPFGRSVLRADICATVPIHFVIADGIIAMEGNGPLHGTHRQLGKVVLSRFRNTGYDSVHGRAMLQNAT